LKIVGRQRKPRSRHTFMTIVDITIREGRNRQVRKMFEAVGHPVLALARLRFGPLQLRSLAPGSVRPLTPAEIAALHRAAAPHDGTASAAAIGASLKISVKEAGVRKQASKTPPAGRIIHGGIARTQEAIDREYRGKDVP